MLGVDVTVVPSYLVLALIIFLHSFFLLRCNKVYHLLARFIY